MWLDVDGECEDGGGGCGEDGLEHSPLLSPSVNDRIERLLVTNHFSQHVSRVRIDDDKGEGLSTFTTVDHSRDGKVTRHKERKKTATKKKKRKKEREER